MFGIGAIALVLLAALVLVLLSGQIGRDTGAVVFVVAALPVMIALVVIVARRWRRARMGHA